MNRHFKNIVFTNPIMYLLYYHLVRKNLGKYPKLPSKENDLYFDGYPRSGNTYTAGLINYFFPSISWTHHLHAEVGIKMALSRKVPCLIIIRDPLDAVASFTFTKSKNKVINKKVIDQCLWRYIDYYSFVSLRKSKMEIVGFDRVIKKPEGFILQLAIKLNLNLCFKQEEVLKKINDYDSKMHDKENHKALEYSSLPTKARDDFKKMVKQTIKSHRNFSEALDLYHSLNATTPKGA